MRITERIKKWRLTVPARASKNVFATIHEFAALRLLVQVPTVSTPPTAASAERIVLKEGTEVPLVFATDLNSKTAVDDDTVNMTLAEDLKVGDVIVVKKARPRLPR